MYINKKNIPPNEEAVQQYVSKHSFATLISHYNGRMMATHTPLKYMIDDGVPSLYGHIAAANEQTQTIKAGKEHLCIFMNTHSYVSSSWYDHLNAPTWNYIAIHITGKTELLGKSDSIAFLDRLSKHYEKGRPKAFDLSQFSDEYLDAYLKGLVAFRIKIEKVEASFKLSQNRDDNNYYNIIKKLEEENDPMSKMIAEEMRKLR